MTSGTNRGPGRHVASEIARAVIRGAFPDVDVRTLRHLGSGWEFDAFLTGDGWVFRFPRHDEAETLFEREGPILELVRPRLPPGTAVPLVERAGRRGEVFPYVVAGHRFIDGVPADSVPPDLPELAPSIGAVLAAIHSVPLEAARAAGVIELDRAEEGRRVWFERGIAGASKLVGSDSVVDQAVAWARRIPDPLVRLAAPLRLIHQDLSPDHVLVDAATGRVTGILDWTDAILGDAARDFVFLVAFGGWELAERVLASYPHTIDPGFAERLRFMARLLPLMWLGWCHARGEDVSRHVGWVRNAFLS